MKKNINLKKFASVNDTTLVKLDGYDADCSQQYVLQTNIRSLKKLLNADPYQPEVPRATFTAYQAYQFVLQLSPEQVDQIVTNSYSMWSTYQINQEQLVFKILNL